MSGLFGGRDSFFNRPSGSLFKSSMFGSSAADDPSQTQRSNAPVIQELDSDSMQMLRDKDYSNREGDKYRENSWANRNPHIEHPDDQPEGNFNTFFCLFVTIVINSVLVTICCFFLVVHNENASKNSSKSTSYGTDHSKVGGTQGRTCGASFQRVTYGGINGPYYTASTRRTTGKDGVIKIFFIVYIYLMFLLEFLRALMPDLISCSSFKFLFGIRW